MNPVAQTIKQKIEDGEIDPDDLEECAELIAELREEYPEAWPICSIADEETLLRFFNE